MANRRYGNAGSVSSLISSARSAYEREQAYQDQIAAYEWDLSAKTAEDHDKYVAYLTKRNKELETRDPAKALTVASKINSTRSSFASKEIQRASIAVNYGQGTDSDKYNKMMGLYQNAVNNGDYDLAQNLESQLGTLQIKIMNAQQAAASAGAAAGEKAYNAVKKGFSSQISDIDANIAALKARQGSMNTAEYQKTLSQLIDMKDKKYLEATWNPESGAANPLGLNEEDYKKMQNDYDKFQVGSDFRAVGGNKGIQATLNPDNKVRNAKGELVDNPEIYGYKQAVGKQYSGFDPILLQNASKEVKDKYSNAFKRLGFEGKDQPSMQIRDFGGNLVNAKLFVDNPDNPSFVYTVLPDGTKYQVNPDGKARLLQDTPDGSIMPKQMQKEFLPVSDKVAANDAEISNRAGVKYTALGQVGNSLRRLSSKQGSATDIANLATGGFVGAGVNMAGDAFNKLAQITGLKQRQIEAQKKEAAEKARVLATLRAQQSAVAAEQQRNAANKQAFTAPPVYNPNSNTLSGALGPRNPAYYAPEAVKKSKTIPGIVNKWLGIK